MNQVLNKAKRNVILYKQQKQQLALA